MLTYAPGGLYLAGPYHGSPFSIVAIDSATVGPFDLGVVVVRSAIRVDPQTAQVSIDSTGSDPIPHIIDGIPIHLRDVRVYIDRPNFTLNPTSCEPFSVASTLTGSGQRFGDPADDTTATATSPFQVFNCAALGFKPKLSLRLKGGTKRGDYPSLRAEVRPRPGDANIASASVALPPSEFLAQEPHRHDLHPRPVRPRSLPRRIGLRPRPRLHAAARQAAGRPRLPALLRQPAARPGRGPARRRQGIAIDVVGRIDSVHGGLRGTFDVLPDAPVSKFVMTLRGGKHGLLVNAEDTCAAPQFATAKFVGQNNRGIKFHPQLAVKCGKGGKHHAKGGKHHGKHTTKKGARR